jgi:hypothetical protein
MLTTIPGGYARWLGCVLALSVGWAQALAAAPTPDPVSSLKELPVYQFVSYTEDVTPVAPTGKQKKPGVKRILVVTAVDLGTKDQVAIDVSENGKNNTAMPAAVKAAKAGSYVEVPNKPNNQGINVASAFKPYPLRDGESELGVFLFVSSAKPSSDGQGYLTVKLYKLGHFAQALVPNGKDSSGHAGPDAKLAKAIDAIKPGQMVAVETYPDSAGTMLRKIAILPPAKTGVVVKITDAPVEGGKTPALEVTIAGSPETILVPGQLDASKHWVPDGKLAAAILPFKAGDSVTVRARTEDDKTWLFEITKSTSPMTAGK